MIAFCIIYIYIPCQKRRPKWRIVIKIPSKSVKFLKLNLGHIVYCVQ